jgi:8-oxo-dGTP diphosphatase
MVRRGPAPDVRAAGGVVWRHRPGGQVEVALVHRPRYDDWSLPKGKLDEGETELVAGVREVGEELGSRVAVSRRIGDVTYQVVVGTKTATYWVMRHLDGTFTPTVEVDDVRWLSPSAARGELTYAYDRRIVADFAAVPLSDSMILLVRHAKAGKRSDWRGPDLERPLERAGEAQAERLAALLALFRPDRIVSAEPVRCVATMYPLADSLGLTVRVDPVFGDESYAKAPQATEDAVMALAKPGHVTVVSSQGDTIPGLIDRLGRGILDSDTKKAAFWALSVVDGSVVSTDYYDDALR